MGRVPLGNPKRHVNEKWIFGKDEVTGSNPVIKFIENV